jgi:xanthine dehydrogenase iron-sulfur cluster and FAD-binding subunit A
VERALTHKPVEMGLNKDVFAGINDDINPIDDFRASRRYRLQVARDLLQEQVLEILGLQVV